MNWRGIAVALVRGFATRAEREVRCREHDVVVKVAAGAFVRVPSCLAGPASLFKTLEDDAMKSWLTAKVSGSGKEDRKNYG